MMSKKLFPLLSLLALASLLLAACQPAAAPYTCTDTLGCVDVAPGTAVHLAYAMVVAGPDSSLGIDSRRGVEIAIADKGTILGHPIELTGEDTGCNAEAARPPRRSSPPTRPLSPSSAPPAPAKPAWLPPSSPMRASP